MTMHCGTPPTTVKTNRWWIQALRSVRSSTVDDDAAAPSNDQPKPRRKSEPNWLLGAACALPLAFALYLSLDNLLVAAIVGFMFTMAFAQAFDKNKTP